MESSTEAMTAASASAASGTGRGDDAAHATALTSGGGNARTDGTQGGRAVAPRAKSASISAWSIAAPTPRQSTTATSERATKKRKQQEDGETRDTAPAQQGASAKQQQAAAAARKRQNTATLAKQSVAVTARQVATVPPAAPPPTAPQQSDAEMQSTTQQQPEQRPRPALPAKKKQPAERKQPALEQRPATQTQTTTQALPVGKRKQPPAAQSLATTQALPAKESPSTTQEQAASQGSPEKKKGKKQQQQPPPTTQEPAASQGSPEKNKSKKQQQQQQQQQTTNQEQAASQSSPAKKKKKQQQVTAHHETTPQASLAETTKKKKQPAKNKKQQQPAEQNLTTTQGLPAKAAKKKNQSAMQEQAATTTTTTTTQASVAEEKQPEAHTSTATQAPSANRQATTSRQTKTRKQPTTQKQSASETASDGANAKRDAASDQDKASALHATQVPEAQPTKKGTATKAKAKTKADGAQQQPQQQPHAPPEPTDSTETREHEPTLTRHSADALHRYRTLRSVRAATDIHSIVLRVWSVRAYIRDPLFRAFVQLARPTAKQTQHTLRKQAGAARPLTTPVAANAAADDDGNDDADAYDITLCDDECKVRAVLHPSLNRLVQLGALARNAVVRVHEWTWQYNERFGRPHRVVVITNCIVVRYAPAMAAPQYSATPAGGAPLPSSPSSPPSSSLTSTLQHLHASGELPAWAPSCPALDRSANVPLASSRAMYLGPLAIDALPVDSRWRQSRASLMLRDAETGALSVTVSPDYPSLRTLFFTHADEPHPIIGRVLRKSSLFVWARPDRVAGAPVKFELVISDGRNEALVVFWNAACRTYHSRLSPGDVIALDRVRVRSGEAHVNAGRQGGIVHIVRSAADAAGDNVGDGTAAAGTLDYFEAGTRARTFSFNVRHSVNLHTLENGETFDFAGVVTYVSPLFRERSVGFGGYAVFRKYRVLMLRDYTERREVRVRLFESSQRDAFDRSCRPGAVVLLTELRIRALYSTFEEGALSTDVVSTLWTSIIVGDDLVARRNAAVGRIYRLVAAPDENVPNDLREAVLPSTYTSPSTFSQFLAMSRALARAASGDEDRNGDNDDEGGDGGGGEDGDGDGAGIGTDSAGRRMHLEMHEVDAAAAALHVFETCTVWLHGVVQSVRIVREFTPDYRVLHHVENERRAEIMLRSMNDTKLTLKLTADPCRTRFSARAANVYSGSVSLAECAGDTLTMGHVPLKGRSVAAVVHLHRVTPDLVVHRLEVLLPMPEHDMLLGAAAGAGATSNGLDGDAGGSADQRQQRPAGDARGDAGDSGNDGDDGGDDARDIEATRSAASAPVDAVQEEELGV